MPTAVDSWKPFEDRVSKVSAGDKACVCVLDDDLSMLKALERLLKSGGFCVQTFHEPEAFLAAVADCPSRMALLDVGMPEMNGLEVQAALQKNAPETRIIF